MKTKITMICVTLLISLSAAAEFKTVARAYEVALSNMRVPATPSSGIVFKQCAECDVQIVRVTPATRYIVNGQTVTLKEFRKSVFQVRNRARETIVVKHHLESDTIVSVSVTI